MFAVCVGGSVVSAQETGSRSAPTYTVAQATAGKAAYDQSCASCHGGNLDDGALAPALKGVAFMQKFGGKRVEELFARIATFELPASQ
jgi:mono/diheme cytochrome c family protein